MSQQPGQMSVERATETLFPTVIQISQLSNATDFNQDLMQKVAKLRKETPNGRPDSWTSSVYTTLNTADQLHLMPEFAELASAIMDEANSFADTLSLAHNQYPLRIKDCWVNIYGSKDGQEMHLHTNSVISGSYYLKVPQGGSGIVLHSPFTDNMFEPPLAGVNALNSGAAELPVEEGMFVLFRSWLKHSVRPSPVKKNRISISFNLMM